MVRKSIHSYVNLNFSLDDLTVEKVKIALVIVADANAHHTLWGSSDNNDKGVLLQNCVLISNTAIANRGEEPTYMGPTWRNV